MEKITREQMIHLESLANGRILPQAYIQFMSVMGNGTKNKFMKGDSCFMDEIDNLKQDASELLEENKSKYTLNDDDFVFWMSQGCMFCFFKLNEGVNPPVYFYNEDGDDCFIKIADTLTEFLINKLELKKNTFKQK